MNSHSYKKFLESAKLKNSLTNLLSFMKLIDGEQTV